MTTIELIGLILGSNAGIEIVKYLFNKKKNKVDLDKTVTETGNLILESELKLTEFYRDQIETMMVKYTSMERNLSDKIQAYEECEARIDSLESKYTNLQRQFTLLKSQMNSK